MRRPAADSSSWPAARRKTKWSRRKSGYCCEHGIFQFGRLAAERKSCGQRGSTRRRSVSCHGQPAEICPHQGTRGARRTRGRIATVYKREETAALGRKEGRRVFSAGVYFPLRGGAQPDRDCFEESRSPVETCFQVAIRANCLDLLT